ENLNKKYLATFIATISNCTYETIQNYLDEIESDTVLKKHIKKNTLQSKFQYLSDSEARYSRRIGWYAFVRAMKPSIVVETGIDKGLGSCVIAAALIKNIEEGYSGYYYGTDI